MLKIKIKEKEDQGIFEGELTIPVEAPEEKSNIFIKGSYEAGEELLRFRLENSHMLFGHTFSEPLTAMDLYIAVTSKAIAAHYSTEVIEGQDLLVVPTIPEGAVS